MNLWGKIQDFSIFIILQFLASYRKTGVLEIQDFEEKGCVYLSEGRVDAISLPLYDDLLGNQLVAAGALTRRELKECLLAHAEQEDPEPIGALLLRHAHADHRALQEIVNRQSYDQALQLSNWSTGTFKFVTADQPLRFSITPSVSVQELLLEASRRLDQGERPRREKIHIEEDVCLTCTIACDPDIKERYLKTDVCLWRNMPTIVRDHVYQNGKGRPADEVNDYRPPDLPFL